MEGGGVVAASDGFFVGRQDYGVGYDGFFFQDFVGWEWLAGYGFEVDLDGGVVRDWCKFFCVDRVAQRANGCSSYVARGEGEE